MPVKTDAETVNAFAKAHGYGFIEAAEKLAAMDGLDGEYMRQLRQSRVWYGPPWQPPEGE